MKKAILVLIVLFSFSCVKTNVVPKAQNAVEQENVVNAVAVEFFAPYIGNNWVDDSFYVSETVKFTRFDAVVSEPGLNYTKMSFKVNDVKIPSTITIENGNLIIAPNHKLVFNPGWNKFSFNGLANGSFTLSFNSAIISKPGGFNAEYTGFPFTVLVK